MTARNIDAPNGIDTGVAMKYAAMKHGPGNHSWHDYLLLFGFTSIFPKLLAMLVNVGKPSRVDSKLDALCLVLETG